jgi:nucleoside-diphosphate-sugar epimerase
MSAYAGKRAVVTGGLGFIGSNLSIRLVELGANVTVIDSSVEGCGANPFNLSPVRDQIRLIDADIGEVSRFRKEIRASDVIFNLAGEISHTESMRCPERDLRINAVSQLRFLLACRAVRPGIRVVYASTRQVYGRPDYLPADEGHPIRPVDFNGIHKFAASQYHLVLTRTQELDALILRLTNVYGPRMALDVPHQGVLGAFLRAAMVREPLVLYGTGEQLRNPVYVDDVVEAFLLAGLVRSPQARVFNVGGPEALSIRVMAEIIAQASGSGPLRVEPFPDGRVRIDVGSCIAGTECIEEHLGWSAKTRFRDGIRRALDYYAVHLHEYVRRIPDSQVVHDTRP